MHMQLERQFGAAVAVGLALAFLDAMLYTPTGWSISHFLGWRDMSPGGTIDQITGFWRLLGTVYAAYLYLLLDTLVFVPVYSRLFLQLAEVLPAAFRDVREPVALRVVAGVAWAGRVSVALVAAFDLVENLAGFARLGHAAAALGVLATGACLFVLRQRGVFPGLQLPRSRVFLAGLAVATLALAAAVAMPALPLDGLVAAGAGASRLKEWSIALMLGAPAVLAAIWFSGAGLDDARKARRAEFRAAVGDMLVRSRYVLIALALLGGLTLLSDQARDVAYAMAASPLDELRQLGRGMQPSKLALQFLGSLPVLAATALAAWAMVFACWLWTRSVCQIQSATSALQPPRPAGRGYEDSFARVWARVMGVAPLFMLMLLLVGVVKDTAQAQRAAIAAADGTWSPRAAWWSVQGMLAVFAVATLAFARWFLESRARQAGALYYDALTWVQWCQASGFDSRKAAAAAKYTFARFVPPYWLPVVVMAALLACRLLDVSSASLELWPADYVPTMALPIILLSIALWLCFFGWLSLLEVRRSIPWVGLLVAVIAAVSWFGWTDNHIVWTGTGARAPAFGMWLATALLGAILLATYVAAMWIVRRKVNGLPVGVWRVAGGTLAFAIAVGAVLAATDQAGQYANEASLNANPPVAAARPTAPEAMQAWLAGLCNAAGPDAGCNPRLPPDAQGRYAVYFVSTEGGGVRAGAWTAHVLASLLKRDPLFLERTFSISGVSGGSVGAAAFRACHLQALQQQQRPGEQAFDEALGKCLDRWSATDYLSPLISAWMFEDALARVFPTKPCALPGCGFLSRAWWFEQAFEGAVPEMARSLGESRGPREPGRHLPYLLLNSTWVETGERAIASDLRIETALFPAAKDQLAIAGHDLALSTAAHNSARFPYTNAIGSLLAVPQACNHRGAGAAAAQGSPAGGGKPEICGHLADGGYFDNGGTQSTLDVVRVFRRCLSVRDDDPRADADGFAPCRKSLNEAQRAWLRARLAPAVLMIRNGVEFTRPQESGEAAAAEASCVVREPRKEPPPWAVQVSAPGDCGSDLPPYVPERPACAAPARTLVELIGPPMAILNVSGSAPTAGWRRRARPTRRASCARPWGSRLRPARMRTSSRSAPWR